MSAALLDVNVLLAMAWPVQTAHELCEDWFERYGHRGWATCAITEAGFVRISSGPAFAPRPSQVHEALQLLALNFDRAGHEFWPCEVSFLDAAHGFRDHVRGHRQTTDAYLLGLAIHHDSQLVTLDRALASLLPAGSPLLRHLLVLE